jgi:hypothetical protein
MTDQSMTQVTPEQIVVFQRLTSILYPYAHRKSDASRGGRLPWGTVFADPVGDARRTAVVALLDVATEHRRPTCACRKASPWWRNMSATSKAGAMMPGQPGGTISNRSRSSGLEVWLIVLVATWA